MTNLIIQHPEDWLDLRTGDRATVKGLLEHVSHDGIVVGFADWSQLSIEGMGAQVLRLYVDSDIEIDCTRTEDGLSMSPEDIRTVRHLVPA